MSTPATPTPSPAPSSGARDAASLPVVETDVLVVGAGPTGLTAAALLARAGVRVVAVSRWPGTAHTPRAHITNQRAMEVFRDLGIEDRVVATATPNELMGQNVWATSVAGTELARRASWGMGEGRRADYVSASPTSMCNIGQHLLEPMLLDVACEHGADVRFDTELVEITQDADGVTGRMREVESGEEYLVRARYAVGADGGRSLVAAQAGIDMEGESGLGHAVNVWFEADLEKYRKDRPGALFFALQPGRDFWLGSGTFVTVRPWNEFVLIVMYNPEVEQIDLSAEAMRARARKIIGDDDVDIHIKDISQWQINHVLATRYRAGRILIGGDAAHRHPPANGLGSNTSVQDSYNLAWKLALVVKGLADESLLDAYEAERRPVGRQVVDRAMDSVGLLGELTPAFGISAGQTDEEGHAALENYFADTPSGAATRAEVDRVLDANDYQFNAHGVELNQRYDSGAVVGDGTPAPRPARDPELYHEPTTRPGAKLPHVWLERDGARASTLDLGGYDRFVMLTGLTGSPWVEAAAAASAEFGVPVDVVRIGPGRGGDACDLDGSWARRREVEESGAVLVRPDRYIAWRADDLDSLPDGPTAALRDVLRRILRGGAEPAGGRPEPHVRETTVDVGATPLT